MSSSVLERFQDFFTPSTVMVEEDDDVFLEQQRRLANDARVFFDTQAYRDYRNMLIQAEAACTPDPMRGTDVAGALALKQAGLRESLALLDRVVSRREVEDA